MKRILSCLFIFLSLFVNFASAAMVTHTATIKAIDQHANGDWLLTFNSDHPACTNANTPNKYYYVKVGQDGVTEESSKRFLTLALSAGHTEKRSILYLMMQLADVTLAELF